MDRDLREQLLSKANVTIMALGEFFTLAHADIWFGDLGKDGGILLAHLTDFALSNKAPKGWQMLSAEGLARRSPMDRIDHERGMQIASGRALKALARKIRTKGKGVIKDPFMA